MCPPKMPRNGGPGHYVFHRAPSPTGPWQPVNVSVDFPCWSENLTPSPFFHPNGSLFIVLHCDADASHAICDLAMVRSDAGWKGPFVRVNDRVWSAQGVSPHPEDPFFWLRRGGASGQDISWHILLHNTPVGIHLYSRDGLNFTLQQQVIGGNPVAPFMYNATVFQTDGTSFKAGRRERPWLLWRRGTTSTPETLVTSMEASEAWPVVFTHVQGVGA